MPPTAVAFGLTLWQLEYRPRAQKKHEPQKMLNGTMTRSPTFRFCTDEPDLVDDADELVAEGVPDPGVRHHAVVEVQVGAADGGRA